LNAIDKWSFASGHQNGKKKKSSLREGGSEKEC